MKEQIIDCNRIKVKIGKTDISYDARFFYT